jgi:hypothetical protein
MEALRLKDALETAMAAVGQAGPELRREMDAGSQDVQSLLGPLADVIAAETAVSQLVFCAEDGSASLPPIATARVLLRKGLQVGSAAAAVSWFQGLRSGAPATGSRFMVLWGVPRTNRVALGEGVELVPLEDLPDSNHKAEFLRFRETGIPSWIMSRHAPEFVNASETAILGML